MHIGGYNQIKVFHNIWESDRCKFEEVLKNVKIIGFFNVCWDILDKRKRNFGQEYVNRRLLSILGKIGIIVSDFLVKMTVFPVLVPIFHSGELMKG